MSSYSRPSNSDLKLLYSGFIDKSTFGITKTRIDYFYSLNANNLDATLRELQYDEYLRFLIEEYHAKLSKFTCPHTKKARQLYHNLIDELVERRNFFTFKKIDDDTPSQLIFDLHWLSVPGAIRYVNDIASSMKNTKKRLMESSEEVMFITGKGVNSVYGVSHIQSSLLGYFGDMMRIDDFNPGRIIMTFKKKLTYSDGLGKIS